jgi:hypothetical protein
MKEIEHALPPELTNRYTEILCKITTGKIPSECTHRDWNQFFTATSDQRLEAWLRVKGLWNDTL